MASIQSIGIGSGVLTNDLIDKLVAAERTPVESRLKLQRNQLDVKVQAYGQIRTAVEAFRSAASALAIPSGVRSFLATSSKDSVFTATASTIASAGSYAIKVKNVAQSHNLVSKSFTTSTESVGSTGTLTIKFGTTTYDAGTDTYSGFTQNTAKGTHTINIGASNNSLTGIRDAINNANIGARASIVDDGTGFRLSITSTESGANNSIQLEVSDNDGDSTNAAGLSAFRFDGTTTQLTQAAAARDSEVEVNGITVTRSTNLVAGAINGVTLNLLQADAGSTHTLTVSADTSTATKRVQALVDAFNQLKTYINDATKFDEKTKVGGPLMGDATLRNLNAQVRATVANSITGLTGTTRSLADIGITTNKDTGLLEFNSSTFVAKLNSSASDVTALLATRGTPSDSLINYATFSSKTVAGTYAIEVTQLATQGVLNGASVLPANFAATPVVIDSGNDNFKIKVNGTESSLISLTQASYTSSTALVNEIQARLNGDSNLKTAAANVTVSYDSTNNRLVFTSGRYGATSKVDITSVDTNSAATLGLSIATGTVGVDVTGKINGATATGLGQRLTAGSASGDAEGLAVDVIGGSTGSRGTVSFIRGVADLLNTQLGGILGSDGALNNKTDTLSKQLSDIDKKQTQLNERLDKLTSRLQRQFSTYDRLIRQLNGTTEFLTNHFKALTAAQSNR